ncbi:MAG TPA: hypothetical protein VGL56_20215 [Fimbriimonadaceae bacterium]|jgi:hypothetical protein
MKCKYLLAFGLLATIGCSSGSTQATPHFVPYVKKTDTGGVVLPTGVPLPPDAVKAGAAKGYQATR